MRASNEVGATHERGTFERGTFERGTFERGTRTSLIDPENLARVVEW